MSRPNQLTEDQLQHVVNLCEDTLTLYLHELVQCTIPGSKNVTNVAIVAQNVTTLRDVALSRMTSEKNESMAEKMARVRSARKPT